MPLPPHLREQPMPPHGEITHEDLAELINAKFERVFGELEKIKAGLR
ncbi:MAG: hypothetical protein HYW22_03070 [Candidatus Aenigmarchaeota archaeon]|nr:hypothetical protein [Candidatus Aenigmarchaeota archaeon]